MQTFAVIYVFAPGSHCNWGDETWAQEKDAV